MTVQVAMADFQERRGGISDYFINIDIADEEVSLDLVQRVFFRVGMIFDVEAQVFSDVTVRTASVRRRAKRVAQVETG